MSEPEHPGDRINRRFYTDHADAFVKKRQYAWAGWDRLPDVQPAPGATRVRVLDLGCGHGRFLRYWAESDRPPVDYVGVDFSRPLLARAQAVPIRPEDRARFVRACLPDDTLPAGEFDLAVAFGLFHHVAEPARRLRLLRLMAESLRPGGTALLTVWCFGKDPRFSAKGRRPPAAVAEPGAVLLDFDGEGERFSVALDDAEWEGWGAAAGLEEVDRFEADGQSGALNQYLVFTSRG